jgi:phage terminase large subunit
VRPSKNISGSVEIEYQIPHPNPKQEKFLNSKKKYTAYGGARGGGKSWAVRVKALQGALTYPGIRILIMRRTYPELESTIILPMLDLINSAVDKKTGRPAGQYVADYRSQMRTIFFTNGSIVKFGHLQSQNALTEYQGQEYDWIFIDEATHFTEYEFRVLGACLRGVNKIPKQMFLTCNPGGIGHQWVKRLFISKEYDPSKEEPKEYFFIPATVEDNTALSAEAKRDYIASLDLLPDDVRAAWRYGDWDALAGQYFSEFRREIHVCKPFRIPKEWPKYRTFDYGLDMFACYWVAVDFEGRIWVYREYCESGLIVSDAAAAMRRLTPPDEFIQYTVAPPDMWSTQKDTGRTMAEIFTREGIGLVRASNARVQGWMYLKEYLKLRPGSDGKEVPGLMITEDCPVLISNLPALQHSEKNPSDVATEPHEITHSPDALRYFCAFRAMGAMKEEPVKYDYEDERLEDYDEAMCGGQVTESYLNY